MQAQYHTTRVLCQAAQTDETSASTGRRTPRVSIPDRLPLCVAALDQVDGVERAVDRTLSAEEEAGQHHHLAATVGRERRDDQGHGQVQQSPEPPTPGDKKKEGNERRRTLIGTAVRRESCPMVIAFDRNIAPPLRSSFPVRCITLF